MNRYLATFGVLLFTLSAVADHLASAAAPPNNGRVFQSNGAVTEQSFFPIAVWLQSPRNAARYKAAGINLYVGLWRGPTEAQLSELEKASMPVICAQNETALAHKDNPIIAGWMHDDEPDNAQSLGRGKGYGPPISPQLILQDYQHLRTADPTRPVLLNLGQGVAWDNYIGRGTRRNHPEDYPEYVKGCDIASFDIYPVVHDSPDIAGKLEFVAKGVERLTHWAGEEKPVWSCIECTHIGNPQAKATPEQVRAEVWMALTRGARGLIYFVHQFKPTSNEAALLDDPEMLSAIGDINRQIHELAPVLNSPTIVGGATFTPSSDSAPVTCMMKRHGNASYIFTVNLGNTRTRGSFALREAGKDSTIEVLGESRQLSMTGGAFSDEYEPYAVHLYCLRNK